MYCGLPRPPSREIAERYARLLGAWDVAVDGPITTEELVDRIHMEAARQAGYAYRPDLAEDALRRAAR